MIAALARALMALAVRGLGDRRREWAVAMQAEFEAARREGQALTFALGCLITACRTLPEHEEGRFAIASHFLALLVIVPGSALMITSILAGFPDNYFGHGGVAGLLRTGIEPNPFLNEGNRFTLPALTLLVLLLAALKLRMAWLALDRDWDCMKALAALSGAATATLVLLSALLFFDLTAALTQLALLTIEMSGLLALARWHSRLPSATF